jgi:hypothetical protein
VSAASCMRRSRMPNNAVSNSPAGGDPPPPNSRWMSDVLTPKVPRAGGFPKVPAPTPPCVFRSPALFSAHSQHTRRPDSVVFLPAIGAFQRHSTQHLLRCRSPSSFHLVPVCRQLQRACYLDFARVRAPRGVPSGFVQRTGCSACGLGYPH